MLAASSFPLRWVGAAEGKQQKVLYFSRSAGFEHDAVKLKDGQPSISDRILTELGKRHGFEVVCTKDGRVFDRDLDMYDAIAFYTSGDLTKTEPANDPPMSPRGKERLLQAVAAGKGFVGFHAATDSFHSKGLRDQNQTEVDPYIAMIGGEFIVHGAQQEAMIRIASLDFPGVKQFGGPKKLKEEWYTLKNFAKDLHVILVEDNEGMEGDCYQRPPFPATWARRHQKGRVFYTSFGHRDDIWMNPQVQGLIAGGLAWAMGNVKFEATPNINRVTPKASQLKY
ncbi:MAG: ThuA domain-containing protein [Phycisphaerales bacterium]|nr:MAG: ThuA domain-containing protein [Phycisphaerales bacterium]